MSVPSFCLLFYSSFSARSCGGEASSLAAAIAPAMTAARAAAARSRPRTIAQTTAAVAASPAPVALTGAVLRALLPRQGARLQQVRLDRREAAEHGGEARGLGRGDRIGDDRRAQVLAEEGDRLRREVSVEHDGVGVVDLVQARAQIRRRERRHELHVGDSGVHLALLVAQIEIDRAARAGDGPRQAHVHAAAPAALAHGDAEAVVAEGGDEARPQPQPREVAGDVAPHAAVPDADRPGGGADDRYASSIHMLSAYSRIARSAAKKPLIAVFTIARRPSSLSSAMRS